MAKRPAAGPIKVPKANRKTSVLRGKDDATFLAEVQRLYRMDMQADEHNIIPALEDMRFVFGDQWDQDARSRRERLKKPVVTTNRLVAYVAQYVGNYLQSDISIKLSPTKGGTKQAAIVRQGLIRATMRTTQAKNALFQAAQTAYICGHGNFGVRLVEAVDDVFARDLELVAFEDPFSVIWDRGSREPTGADARRCYEFEWMTKEDFHETWSNATTDTGWFTEEWDLNSLVGHGWEVDEMVRVCRFWQMRYEPVTLGLASEDGNVIDISDMSPNEYLPLLAVGDDGTPIMRKTVKPYAECYVLTSSEVLEGPYRLDIPRLPIFRVQGWRLYEGPTCYRWGFVRNAKDPQRISNWWDSVLAEELRKSNAGKWLLDQVAMKNGLADRFRNSHMSDDNVLFWDSQTDGQKPEWIPPPPMNTAVLTERTNAIQNIKDVTNKHEAAMGITGNEVSGKAITAHQRVSEMGDVIYVENVNAAQAECGKVMNALIPVVYDTNRTVKIMGDEDQDILQEINGEFGDATPDVTIGKYDMTYSTGPSYATKRQESVDLMMTLMNTMPQTGNLIADIIVRNMDIPGADEISDRLAFTLPPGMADPDKLSGKMKQIVEMRSQFAMQQMQIQVQMQLQEAQAKLAHIAAQINELDSRAGKQTAQANREASEVGQKVMHDIATTELAAARVHIDLGTSLMQMGLEAAISERDAQKALGAPFGTKPVNSGTPAQQEQPVPGQVPQQPAQQPVVEQPQAAQPTPPASGPTT
jgi:hypothetical protein